MNREARKLAKQIADNSPRGIKRFLREWIIPPGWLDLLGKALVTVRNKISNAQETGFSATEAPSTVNFLRFGYGREFVIDVANIRNKVGFAYTLEQHQYRRYLNESPENRLNSLRKFYEAFQPASLAELFFVSDDSPNSRREGDPQADTWFDNPNGGPWNLSQVSPFMSLPWDPAPATEVRGRKEGTQFFGPYSETKTQREAIRLENLLRSIRRLGYRPDLFDGPFGGHLLTRHYRGERQAVFLPYEGSHRMAVLSHLGATKVEVKFDPARPRECRIEDVKSFEGVRDGRFTVEQAEILFHSFFRDPHEVLISDW